MTGWWAGITMIIAFALIALLPYFIVLGLHTGGHH
jgi:hypothetical protein